MKTRGFFLLAIALVLAWAALAQAQPVMAPPMAGQAIRQCLDCHRLPNLASNEGVLANRAMCQECHARPDCARVVAGTKVSLQVAEEAFKGSRHAMAACVSCHQDVARSPHKSVTGVSCASCHTPHAEGSIGDPHLTVRCEACHHKSPHLMREAGTGRVALAKTDGKGLPLTLADHGKPDLREEALCARCHLDNNPINAPTMVLPNKGMICFLCHPASFSIGNPWFGLALLVFLAGMVGLVRLWMKGRVVGQEGSFQDKLSAGSEHVWSLVFSRRFREVLGVIVFDIILGRRLLQESVQRWFFHSLIYMSMLARMGLGLFTWLVVTCWPASSLALALMDKNHPFVAFANDLLGLFMLLGILLAALQRLVVRPAHVKSEWQDGLALTLLGLLTLLGFVTEAMRLAMSAPPPETAWMSFVAYPLSVMLAGDPAALARAFGWVWWGHAACAALLVAWIPFGKMRHIFAAPLSLLLNRERA